MLAASTRRPAPTQVDWCSRDPGSNASIIGSVVKSDTDGLARFQSLRVLNSPGNHTHCLQVRVRLLARLPPLLQRMAHPCV
jgi:hypothetical protein